MFPLLREIWVNLLGFPTRAGGPKLSAEEQIARARFYWRVLTARDTLLKEYCAKFHDAKHRPTALVLDTDAAKELCPEYARDAAARIRYSFCVYEPAKIFIRDLYRRTVEQPAVSYVLFFAGGTASGKSTASNAWHGKSRVDGTLSRFDEAHGQIRHAFAHGKQVIVTYIFCEIEIALRRAIERAVERGRALSLRRFAETHFHSQQTVLRLHECFGSRDDFHFRIIDKTGRDSLVCDLRSFDTLRYESLEVVFARAQAAYRTEILRREDKGQPLRPELLAAFGRDGRRVG